MMKKTVTAAAALLAAGAAVAAPAANAAAPSTTADAAVSIKSGAPVQGLMTAGSFKIANNGPQALPTGTQFKVHFSALDGSASRSGHTVTCPDLQACTAQQDPTDNNSYIVTLNRPLGVGKSVNGLWSNHHYLNGTRDKVTIEETSVPKGTVDPNTANNTAVYDNANLGF